jgi:hypothetical protein
VAVHREEGEIVFDVQDVDINGKDKYGKYGEFLFDGKILPVVCYSATGMSPMDKIVKCGAFDEEKEKGCSERNLGFPRTRPCGKNNYDGDEVEKIIINHFGTSWLRYVYYIPTYQIL